MREKSDSHTLAEDMDDMVEKGKKAVTDTVKSVEEQYGEIIEQVTTLVRKHPIEALAIGFGAGCLVGLLLTRR